MSAGLTEITERHDEHLRFADNIPEDLRRDRPFQLGGIAMESFGIIHIPDFWQGHEVIKTWLDDFIARRQPRRTHKELVFSDRFIGPGYSNMRTLITLVNRYGFKPDQLNFKRYDSENPVSTAHDLHMDPEWFWELYTARGEPDQKRGILIASTHGYADLTLQEGRREIYGEIGPEEAVWFSASAAHAVSIPKPKVGCIPAPKGPADAAESTVPQRRSMIALQFDPKFRHELDVIRHINLQHPAPDAPYI